MNEYVIINKTELKKIYEFLKQQREVEPDNYAQSYFDGKIKQLDLVLSQSTSLIPEIEKAYTKAFSEGLVFGVNTEFKYETSKEYISKLKLDI